MVCQSKRGIIVCCAVRVQRSSESGPRYAQGYPLPRSAPSRDVLSVRVCLILARLGISRVVNIEKAKITI